MSITFSAETKITYGQLYKGVAFSSLALTTAAILASYRFPNVTLQSLQKPALKLAAGTLAVAFLPEAYRTGKAIVNETIELAQKHILLTIPLALALGSAATLAYVRATGVVPATLQQHAAGVGQAIGKAAQTQLMALQSS